MPKPAITTFSSLAVSKSPTNKDNGLYPPELTQNEIDNIPADTLREGGLVFNTDQASLQTYNKGWININTSAGDVIGPDGAIQDNIVTFADDTGKILQDSTVNIKSVPALLFSERSAKKRDFDASLVNVNEIGNLGHIKFVNDIGIVFVDGLMPVEFITNDIGSESQVCSLFTGDLPGTSSSPSALVELQTTTGTLLLSRLTQTEIDALTLPVEGMVVYNTDNRKFSVYNDNGWVPLLVADTSGNLDMQGYKIINLATGSNSLDAANIEFVNAAISGIPAATITLTGGVSGSGVVTSPISTTVVSVNPSVITGYPGNTSTFLRGDGTWTNILSASLGLQTLNLYNAANTQFIGLKAGNLTTNTTWTLPLTDGTNGQVLSTNGSATLSWNSVAPSTAKYIIQTANASLPNAQSLGALSTGLVKNTTTTGVLSIATAGADYYAPGFPTFLRDTTGASTYNFFAGTNTGNNTVTGFSNVGTGCQVMTSISTGSYNTASGYQSLQSVVDGQFNVGAGIQALNAIVSNFGNVAVGAFALGKLTTGNYNIAIGQQAGLTSTNISNCILIGNSAGASTSGLSNAIAIGANATVSASNAMVLGNGCNVGIGTSSPSFLLNIVGGTAGSIKNILTLASPRSFASSVTDGVQIIATASNGTLGSHDYGSIIFSSNPNTVDGGGAIARFSVGGGSSNSNTTSGVFLYAETNMANVVNRVQIRAGSPSTAIATFSSGVNLQFSNTLANRKIVLLESANNDHQVIGLGTASNIFRFQVPVTTTDYVWYAGTSSTTSNELMRLTGMSDLVVQGNIYGNRPSGQLYISGSLTTFAANNATPQKLSTTTTSAQLNQFTAPVNNQLLYVGTRSILASISLSVSMASSAASGDTVYSIFVYKNGTELVGSRQNALLTRGASLSAPVAAITSNTLTTLNTNDYLEVYVALTGGAGITGNVSYMSLVVTAV